MRVSVPVTVYYRLAVWIRRGTKALQYKNVAKDDPQRGHVRWLEWSNPVVPELGSELPAIVISSDERWKYRLVAVVSKLEDLVVEGLPPN